MAPKTPAEREIAIVQKAQTLSVWEPVFREYKAHHTGHWNNRLRPRVEYDAMVAKVRM